MTGTSCRQWSGLLQVLKSLIQVTLLSTSCAQKWQTIWTGLFSSEHINFRKSPVLSCISRTLQLSIAMIHFSSLNYLLSDNVVHIVIFSSTTIITMMSIATSSLSLAIIAQCTATWWLPLVTALWHSCLLLLWTCNARVSIGIVQYWNYKSSCLVMFLTPFNCECVLPATDDNNVTCCYILLQHQKRGTFSLFTFHSSLWTPPTQNNHVNNLSTL